MAPSHQREVRTLAKIVVLLAARVVATRFIVISIETRLSRPLLRYTFYSSVSRVSKVLLSAVGAIPLNLVEVSVY